MAKNRTISYKLLNANLISDSIKSETDSYYIFAAKHTTSANNGVLETPVDSEAYKNQVYFDMLFGKKIQPNDVVNIIDRHDWTLNNVYTQYDDSDATLSSKSYYAVVNADSQYYVYKCLYNADNSPSTVEPDFTAVSDGSTYYETSDGYIWKYMYSVNSSIVQKFSTSTKFPIIANLEVSDAAVAGAIDIISVVESGNGYNNYLAGDNRFNSFDIALNGNDLLYNISANSSAASSNDYYNGCYIYIKSGLSNEVGQFKKIVDYSVNSTSKTITLESSFTNSISISAIYDIYPGVSIYGDGSQTVNAEARVIISPYGNTVQNVEMLNTGSGYKKAVANVIAHATVNAGGSELKVIQSPYGGHGFDQYIELGSSSIGVSVTFANAATDFILDTNDYSTVGILRNPVFSKVEIQHKTTYGIFFTDEIVYKIVPTLVATAVNLQTNAPSVTSDSANFENQFNVGDFVYFSNISNDNNMMSKVVSITNTSHMVIASNAAFTSNAALAYIPNIQGHGHVETSNTTSITLRGLTDEVNTDDNLVGYDSGAISVANNVTRSGTVKGFNSFINTYKYSGELIAGTFLEDETIYQVSLENANSIVHSTVVDGSDISIYATNQFGQFVPLKNIYGANSESSASTSTVYEPEVIHRSGEILYLETISPVKRLPTQSETFKIILEF